MSIIRTDYILSPYQKGSWIIEIKGHHFIISEYTKKLIDIVSTTSNIIEAQMTFNKEFEMDLTEEEFHSFIKETLEKMQLLNKGEISWEKTKNFIRFQFQILSPDMSGRLAAPFEFLFSPKFFWFFFSFLASLSLFILLSTDTNRAFSALIIITSMYLPTIFLHELGHIAACRKFTGRNSEIGGGIYFIFPVLYSNISQLWLCNKEQKIIGNLAGVYMQLLCMFILYGIYSLTHLPVFEEISYLIALYSLLQLIPFIRSDGYWLLADIASIPNLHQQSSLELKNLINNRTLYRRKSWKEIFILVYGIFNYATFLYFILFQLIFNWKGILDFPLQLWGGLRNILMLDFSILNAIPFSITPVVFYAILLSYILSLRKRVKNLFFI